MSTTQGSRGSPDQSPDTDVQPSRFQDKTMGWEGWRDVTEDKQFANAGARQIDDVVAEDLTDAFAASEAFVPEPKFAIGTPVSPDVGVTKLLIIGVVTLVATLTANATVVILIGDGSQWALWSAFVSSITSWVILGFVISLLKRL